MFDTLASAVMEKIRQRIDDRRDSLDRERANQSAITKAALFYQSCVRGRRFNDTDVLGDVRVLLDDMGIPLLPSETNVSDPLEMIVNLTIHWGIPYWMDIVARERESKLTYVLQNVVTAVIWSPRRRVFLSTKRCALSLLS